MREVAETTNRRTHTDGTTTVTLAAHAHRGLITIIIVFVFAMAHGIVMEGLLSTDVKLTFNIIHVISIILPFPLLPLTGFVWPYRQLNNRTGQVCVHVCMCVYAVHVCMQCSKLRPDTDNFRLNFACVWT